MESKECPDCGKTHSFFECNKITPERELILRIVSQWGNAVEMPNMDQWIKDYAANAPTGPRWVRASERLPENDNLVHINYRTNNTTFKLTGFYEPSQKKWYRQSRGALEWAPNLEWLDETPERQSDSEQDRKDGKELSAYYAHIEAKELHQLAISLRLKGDRLVSILRSLRLSVTAHPDYTGQPNAEWTDLVNASDEAIMNWLEKEVKP